MGPKTYFYSFFIYLTVAQALEHDYHSNSTIQWGPCTARYNVSSERGLLEVPRDYTAMNSSDKLNLQLFKAKAVNEPFLGSIIINPGARLKTDFWRIANSDVPRMTGGQHDVIGFDSRATGSTLNFSCYADPAEQAKTSALMPYSTNVSDTASGSSFSLAKSYAGRCKENGGELGELVGTAFAARDMMQIVDALGEDGMLRYWGQSYGTYLGEVAAAMFPHRIDKLVLDGVFNPHEYTDGWEYGVPAAGDLALQEWTKQCIDVGFPACPLAANAEDATSLQAKIVDLIYTAKFEPIVMGNSNLLGDVVDMSTILSAIDSLLRQALEAAPIFTPYLHALFERNTTAWTGIPMLPFNDPVNQIRCSDTSYRTDRLDEIESRVQKMSEASLLWGPYWSMSPLVCATYQMQAKGRYTGDFRAATKNAALLIGSPFDLRTPIAGAYNASEALEGSVVLRHNGHGHGVMFSPGQCAIRAVQDYFVNGTLPEPGTVCEQDFGIFSGKTPKDSFVLSKL